MKEIDKESDREIDKETEIDRDRDNDNDNDKDSVKEIDRDKERSKEKDNANENDKKKGRNKGKNKNKDSMNEIDKKKENVKKDKGTLVKESCLKSMTELRIRKIMELVLIGNLRKKTGISIHQSVYHLAHHLHPHHPHIQAQVLAQDQKALIEFMDIGTLEEKAKIENLKDIKDQADRKAFIENLIISRRDNTETPTEDIKKNIRAPLVMNLKNSKMSRSRIINMRIHMKNHLMKLIPKQKNIRPRLMKLRLNNK